MKEFTFSKAETSCSFTKHELFHRYYFADVNGYFYLYFKVKSNHLQENFSVAASSNSKIHSWKQLKF